MRTNQRQNSNLDKVLNSAANVIFFYLAARILLIYFGISNPVTIGIFDFLFFQAGRFRGEEHAIHESESKEELSPEEYIKHRENVDNQLAGGYLALQSACLGYLAEDYLPFYFETKGKIAAYMFQGFLKGGAVAGAYAIKKSSIKEHVEEVKQNRMH